MILFMLINLTYGTTNQFFSEDVVLFKVASNSGSIAFDFKFLISYYSKQRFCNDLYLAMPGNSSACGSDLYKGPLLFFKYILQGKQ